MSAAMPDVVIGGAARSLAIRLRQDPAGAPGRVSS